MRASPPFARPRRRGSLSAFTTPRPASALFGGAFSCAGSTLASGLPSDSPRRSAALSKGGAHGTLVRVLDEGPAPRPRRQSLPHVVLVEKVLHGIAAAFMSATMDAISSPPPHSIFSRWNSLFVMAGSMAVRPVAACSRSGMERSAKSSACGPHRPRAEREWPGRCSARSRSLKSSA
jgi:hypothetical protein